MLAVESPRYTARPGFVVLILALAVPLLACGAVERTVTRRAVVAEERGDVRTLTWESDRYPAQTLRHPDDECWDAAVVGEAVPGACLTAGALAAESDPFEQALWPASASAVFAIATLLLIAWKRVSWQPVVGRTTAGAPPPRQFDPDDAVALMRNIEDERASRIVAERRRRDLSPPVLAGMLVPVPLLALVTLLVGYGAAFGWAMGTGLFLFVGITIYGALFLLSVLRPADTAAAVSRLLFLGGATATLLLGSFGALLLRTPLLELNGIDWLA